MTSEGVVLDRLNSVLRRPEMWAGSCETLEAHVTTLLWFVRGGDVYREWCKFCRNRFPEWTTSVVLWQQRKFEIVEYAKLLQEFSDTYLATVSKAEAERGEDQ